MARYRCESGTFRMNVALSELPRFACLPEDDLTLATVLKSPLYGFDDGDLFRLAYGRKGSLWRALKSRSAEEPRWQRACDELSALLARADFLY